MVDVIREYDEDRLRTLLVGKTVTKISDKELLLSDGTVLELEGNDGCGGCPSGYYELSYLNDCPDNMIMNVKIVEFETGNNKYEPDRIYSIFVIATDSKLMELANFHGNDGNGYYGTGFHIRVKKPE